MTEMLYEILDGNTGMLDVPRQIHLCHDLIETADLDGVIVEFGCYEGQTSMVLRILANGRQVHVYDSFQGLPSRQPVDGDFPVFKEGALRTEEETLRNNFQHRGLVPPVIHRGFFRDLSPSDVPSRISLAFIDGDFYDSITDALRLVFDKVVPGGVILIDDYGHPELPGVKTAVDLFLALRSCTHAKAKGCNMYRITKPV